MSSISNTTYVFDRYAESNYLISSPRRSFPYSFTCIMCINIIRFIHIGWMRMKEDKVVLISVPWIMLIKRMRSSCSAILHGWVETYSFSTQNSSLSISKLNQVHLPAWVLDEQQWRSTLDNGKCWQISYQIKIR